MTFAARCPALLLFLCFLHVVGCSTGPDDVDYDCDDGQCDEAGIRAVCTASVQGRGTFDVELEYLPRVLACENPDGDFESLKAQAIAARSYLYYKVRTSGSIGDGQGDQVFTCDRRPSDAHRRAVEATSGQVLRYRGTQVAAFYVAGAFQNGASCTGGTSDPTRTERFVTYNAGRSGTGIQQTSLGFRHPTNHANRGCMSQHGANCLAARGRSTGDILRFYYGEDIEVARARGECVVDGPGLTSSEIWVGEPCADDRACDFQDGRCAAWFDEDADELFGFCTASCDGFCPDAAGHPTSFCVDLGGGVGSCATTPASQNDFCRAIPGAEAHVLPRHVGASGAEEAYRSVCVPPGLATSCTADDGRTGECIDTGVMQCGGELRSGLCPGGGEIRCCLD